jgi:subfamily B ATP-binding cassette protein MsbA
LFSKNDNPQRTEQLQIDQPAETSSAVIYKRLLGYTLVHRKGLWIALIGFLLYAQTQWAWAELTEYIIGALTKQSDPNLKYWIPMGMLVIVVLRGIGSFLGVYGITHVSRHVMYQLRQQVFHHVLRLPSAYFDKNPAGSLLAKITYNIEKISGASSDAIKVILQEGLTTIGLLIYLFIKNWKLALLFIGIAPVIAWVVGATNRRLRLLSQKIQDSMGEVANLVNEAVYSQELIRAYGARDPKQKAYDAANQQNLRQGVKLSMAEAINTPVVQILVAFIMSIVVYIALHEVSAGNTKPESFIAFLMAALLLAKPIRQLTQMNAVIQQGIVGAKSIFELLDEPSEIQSLKNSSEPLSEINKTGLVFDKVSFTYSSQTSSSLNGIDLQISPGQMLALVGPSGSGKTTLSKLLLRFYDPDFGHIYYKGKSISMLPLDEWRDQVAWVGQQVLILNGTVADNIAFGKNLPIESLQEAAKKANAWEFIQKLPQGLDTILGVGGIGLSGGQAQRIAIARAIARDADILVLDEATAALDSISEQAIQKSLETFGQNKIVIVIAHRLATIQNADVIAVMDQGTLVESGSHAELLHQEGLYWRLYQHWSENENQ